MSNVYEAITKKHYLYRLRCPKTLSNTAECRCSSWVFIPTLTQHIMPPLHLLLLHLRAGSKGGAFKMFKTLCAPQKKPTNKQGEMYSPLNFFE